MPFVDQWIRSSWRSLRLAWAEFGRGSRLAMGAFRKTARAGFTAALQPDAGFASCYRKIWCSKICQRTSALRLLAHVLGPQRTPQVHCPGSQSQPLPHPPAPWPRMGGSCAQVCKTENTGTRQARRPPTHSRHKSLRERSTPERLMALFGIQLTRACTLGR
ncbi:hypothetical protein D9M73_193970 [compost metagenome]